MAELVTPSANYKASFLAAVREYQAEGLKKYQQLDLAWLEQHFNEYVQQLQDESQGKNLTEGMVPHTVYWLVEGNEFLGQSDIRHYLTEQLQKEGGHVSYDIRPSQRKKGYGSMILSLALQKTKELGMKDVLLTCDVSNIGSNKIIQKVGGQLQDVQHLSETVVKNRYRVQN